MCFSVLLVHFFKIVDLVEVDIFEDVITPLFLFDVLDVKHHLDAFALVELIGFVDEAEWFLDGQYFLCVRYDARLPCPGPPAVHVSQGRVQLGLEGFTSGELLFADIESFDSVDNAVQSAFGG